MSALLIRGLTPQMRRQIQRLADRENLSLNQAMLQLLKTALELKEEKADEEENRRDVFERIEKLREEISRKYGKFGDSAKLIREERDKRARRWTG